MSTQHSEAPPVDQQSQEEAAAIKALVDSFAKSNMQDDHLDGAGKPVEKLNSSNRPMRIYTREQLLHLSNSPLVQLPPNMPELKQWFGDNELVLTKKDNDLPSSGSGRERRFRREVEDSEMSSRPSFRSSQSQPSQMGNFKHQSLRSGDRERDTDRDRDRDARDKEGLRHLSDKYDRERLGMIPSSTRGKDRETPSHISTTSSSRANASQGNLTARRGDPRESTKKRTGETGDDWRRNDSSRNTRDDRDERAASRARDTSRSRRSRSRSQREKDDGRSSKNDRDRERDNDRDQDDDPRRWRDDGKRDERMAARRVERDRELRPRERDRGDHWEPSNDRRWASNEDRDGRYKRSSARDRKSGAPDELKDREERREREKEKEPAWMETYVPTPSSGILGGKSDTGELDGIQIWKKGLKEKEAALQEKNNEILQSSPLTSHGNSEKGLDEIQLFKLLMKREEEKMKNEVFGEDVASETGQKIPVPSNGSMGSPTSETVAGFQHSKPSSSTVTLEVSESSSSLPSVQNSTPFEVVPQKNQSTVVTSSNIPQATEKPVTESSLLAGSRLLALSRSSAKSPINTLPIVHTAEPNGFALDAVPKPGTPRTAAGLSPFNDLSRINYGEEVQLPLPNQYDSGQRVLGDKSFGAVNSPNSVDVSLENTNSAYASNKGSRFAKFFDNRTKENPLSLNKSQTPTGFVSSSPSPLQRQEQAIHSGGIPTGANERTMEDIFAMLNNSTQRANPLNQPSPHQPLNNGLVLNHHINAPSNAPSQSHHLQSNSRIDALYDSQIDDRSFVPDGMVPGLRTVPPPRVRDNVGLYQELPEEAFRYHVQRLQQQHQRNPDPFVGNAATIYGPQAVRNIGLAVHQPQYRGGPSPSSTGQNALPNLQTQRLPPGLANLGGRPPHDPTQFITLPGHPNALPGNIHLNAPPAQQPFNNFVATNNINFSNPPLRGPIPNIHQLQNPVPHPGLGSLGLGQNPNQLLSVGGINMPGPRGAGFNPPQPNNHLQGPLLGAARQQTHLPPQIPPHLMPQHFQQQGLNGPTSQQAHDLMALLMGGSHRE